MLNAAAFVLSEPMHEYLFIFGREKYTNSSEWLLISIEDNNLRYDN